MPNRLPLPPELMALIEKRDEPVRRSTSRRTIESTTDAASTDVPKSTASDAVERRKSSGDRRKSPDRRGSRSKRSS